MNRSIHLILKSVLVLLVILAVLLGWLWFRSPIQPETIQLSAVDKALMSPQNSRLQALTRLGSGALYHPEDVALGPDGLLYLGLGDGRIVRTEFESLSPQSEFQEFAHTGGRPLGLVHDTQGNLIVADADKGLLLITPGAEVHVLVDSFEGVPLKFTDHLDIADDGTVWFSDASMRYGYNETVYDFLEAGATGRLLSYNPNTGQTQVHMDNLYFANGVALGPDDQYVLVNETGTGKVHRYWLTGDQAGTSDLFVNALPGGGDNIDFNGVDTYWIAIPYKINPDIAQLKWLRRLLAGLPYDWIQGEPISRIVGVNLQGEVTHILDDPKMGFLSITSATEIQGRLFIGSIKELDLAVLPLR